MKKPKETPPAGTEGAENDAAGFDELSASARTPHDPYQNIPAELRALPQWVAATAGKVPINPRTGAHASPTDPHTWATFEEAIACGHPHIGFALTAWDPYVVIDIDDKADNPASDEQRGVQRKVLDSFQSYTERSVGARWTDANGNERGGYHIILRGTMQGGRDRGHVAVYSCARYIIFTGDVVRHAPVINAQALLDALLAEMPTSAPAAELVQVEGHLADSQLHDMAMRADNGEKYAQLCRGEWKEMGYPSQSEADLALISMLAFYTRDNEQVRRMFRCTALGKSAKAIKNNGYLDRTLQRARSDDVSDAQIEEARQVAAAISSEPTLGSTSEPRGRTNDNTSFDLPPPQGLLGDLISYFNRTALYPMHEGATLAALGLMAGVAGRAFNFMGSGLNLYLLLLAESGRGKEDMARGIERILGAVRGCSSFVDDFVGPRKFASGQALNGALSSNPCFVSIQSEFGLRLKELNDPRAPASTTELRVSLLDLYAKSGQNDTFRATAYADRDKNTKIVKSPAVSILGESTPGHVFDNLSFRDIEDGLLPRTLVMQATGDRPSANASAYELPDEALVNRFADLVATVMQLGGMNPLPIEPRAIALTPDAQRALAEIQAKFDADYNDKARNPYDRALWNRAGLNIRRIAGLIAVGCMPGQHSTPLVEFSHLEWAYRFVEHCVGTLGRQFREGLVGNGESRLEGEIRSFIFDYVAYTPFKRNDAYQVPKKINHEGHLVTLGYLRQRAKPKPVFNQHPRGMDFALTQTLSSMCRTGALIRIEAREAKLKWGILQEIYVLASPEEWGVR